MELTLEEKITGKAADLFNKKGLSNTSLRDIATALAISDGHLRYYFKTKEDLVLSTYKIFVAQIASFDGMDGKDISAPGWEQMASALTRTFNAMHRFAYFYLEPFALDAYPSVRKEHAKLMTGRKQLFKAVFKEYQKRGVFNNDIDKSLLPALYEHFFIISDNWIKYSRNHKHSVSEIVAHYVALCLALLLPYFTSGHQKKVKGYIKRKLLSM